VKDQIQTVLQRAKNNETVGFYEHSLTERHLSQEIALSTCRMLEHGRITRGSKGEKQAPHAPLTIVAPLLSRASKLATPPCQRIWMDMACGRMGQELRVAQWSTISTTALTQNEFRKMRHAAMCVFAMPKPTGNYGMLQS